MAARRSRPTSASATNERRVAHRDALREALEERLRAAPAASWAPRLLAAGVPAGEVNDVAGAFALAERLGLAPVVTLPDADGRPVRLTANPIRLSRTPATYRSAPPSLP